MSVDVERTKPTLDRIVATDSLDHGRVLEITPSGTVLIVIKDPVVGSEASIVLTYEDVRVIVEELAVEVGNASQLDKSTVWSTPR